MKTKTKTMVVLVLVIVLGITSVGKALAAGSYSSYNKTVPRLNGSTTTSNKTKQSASDTATVCSNWVALNYVLRARIEDVNNNAAAGYQTIDDQQRRNYTLSPSTAGANYHARLKSYIYITVNVVADGKWSPDNPGGCGF
ncbi:MAG: hypothetical protein OEZ02_07130 [Anaerolineae bacterium]|nr:hypothetical protein [Anaerolineae bacterium]